MIKCLVSVRTSRPGAPAPGSPSQNSTVSWQGVSLPCGTLKVLTETSQLPVSASHPPQLALGARQDSPSFPLPIHGEGVPERAGVRFQGQAAMKTNPVAQIISVSTSGPGAPAPGSPKQKSPAASGRAFTVSSSASFTRPQQPRPPPARPSASAATTPRHHHTRRQYHPKAACRVREP